jgi:hypothetical protein
LGCENGLKWLILRFELNNSHRYGENHLHSVNFWWLIKYYIAETCQKFHLIRWFLLYFSAILHRKFGKVCFTVLGKVDFTKRGCLHFTKRGNFCGLVKKLPRWYNKLPSVAL